MTEKDFRNSVNWGYFTTALVRPVHFESHTRYEVVRPGRINGEDILDKNKIYSMDILDRINRKLNQRAGRFHASFWIQFIDQE